MTTYLMIPGVAAVADQAVTRTAAAELPAHVKPGRTWRNTRSDGRGTWHLPAVGGMFADAICGAFIVAVVNPESKSQRWIAADDEPATACKRCLQIVERRDAAAAVAEKTDDAL